MLVYRLDDNYYGPVNGIHRYETFKRAQKPSIDGYLLDVADMSTINRLRVAANLLNGDGPGYNERMEIAVERVANGLTARDAAEQMLIPQGALATIVRTRKLQRRINSLVDSPGNITEKDAAKLNTISRDRHLKAIVELKRDARLSGEAFSNLVVEVRSAEHDEAADAVLVRWRDEYKEIIAASGKGKYRPVASSPLRNLPNMFRKAEALLQDPNLQILKDYEMASLATKCRDMATKLVEFATRLEEIRASTP